ncbi:MAG: hypothetical protein H6807_16495 [Planctomycetes bacterium]|nr:hypothetical protein [Planctomycetota bacterium]
MKAILAAFGYQLARSSVNRLRALVGRLRKPRYLLGALFAAAYLWFFLFRGLARERALDPVGAGAAAIVVVQGYFLVNLLIAWIFGALGRGLIFREAEVELLFPAPVSRPQLLLFKLIQAQFGQIIGALVLSLFAHRSLPDRSFAYLVPSFWLIGNALHLHSIFVTLSLRSLSLRRGLGWLLAWLPGLLILVALLGAALISARAIDGIEGFGDIERLVAARPLGYLLAPVRFLAVLVVFSAGSSWFVGAGILVAASVLLFQLLVLADHRFEDQALKNASMLGRVKREGAAGLADPGKLVVKGEGPGFPVLHPLGPVWRALVWKNVISIGRLPRAATRAIFIVIPFLVAALMFTREHMEAGKGQAVLSFMFLVVAAYGSLLGPSFLRVDLRIDLPHFDVLKALPIRGRDLLLGEVLGPTLVVFTVQFVLVGLGLYLLPDGLPSSFDWQRRVIAFLVALPVLFALDFALFSLENLLALHMPSFVRFGRGLRQGFDQFGQNILGAIVRVLVLVVFLLPAAVVGLAVIFLLGLIEAAPLEARLFIGLCCAALVLVGVAYALLVLSEKRYENFDLSAEALGVEP